MSKMFIVLKPMIFYEGYGGFETYDILRNLAIVRNFKKLILKA